MATMGDKVRDVMTKAPVVLRASAKVGEAARVMREKNIGDVIVTRDDVFCGIVTDRDIVVRTIALGKDPTGQTLDDVCSKDVTTLSPDDTVERAIALMREKAVRRLPVVERGAPIGIVSLGDLAQVRDEKSVLGKISAAPPNR